MNRDYYLSQIHKIRAKMNLVEEYLCVWDYEDAYKKLLMIGLDSERFASELKKDPRFNPSKRMRK